MSEPIIVDAEVIEDEQAISPLSGLDVLVASVAEDAARIAKEHRPTDIKGEDEYAQAKRDRAKANGDIKALKARYDEQMKAIKTAVREADARMKAALAPLSSIEGDYKAKIGDYEVRWTSERIAAIREAYEDFAPDIALPQEGQAAPLVPFDLVLKRFGTEKGKSWTLRSNTTEAQAIAAMEQAVRAIANDEKTIESTPYDAQDKAELRAEYFRTLDLSASLRVTQARIDERKRVAELDRQRKEREEQARRAAQEAAERQRAEAEAAQMAIGQPEQPQQVAAPQPPRPVAPPQPRALETHTMVTPEQYVAMAEQVGTPVSNEVRERLLSDAAQHAGMPQSGERIPDYVFCGYGNQQQAEAFIAFCERSGISRRVKMPSRGKAWKLTPRQ